MLLGGLGMLGFVGLGCRRGWYHFEMSGDVEVDQFEEGEDVSRGVGLAAVGEHLTGGHVKGGEDVGGAVPAVVVGHGAGPTRLEGQRWLGAVQRLGLGLLVEAEHRGPLRRIQVETDHVASFSSKRGSSDSLKVETRHGLR